VSVLLFASVTSSLLVLDGVPVAPDVPPVITGVPLNATSPPVVASVP